MKEVIEIFKQLQNTSGKKDKEKIIAANQDNELFKGSLMFLLDDRIQTGIKTKSLQKDIKYDGHVIGLETWEDVVLYLIQNNTGKDYDILAVQMFIRMNTDMEDKWFYEGMVTKTLKIGVDAKTVNKVIPNLIYEWKVQLGSSSDKLRLRNGEKFFLSQKLNGVRCSYYKGKMMSRQGKEFEGLDHIIADINKYNLDNYFIDGELIRINKDNVDDNENFRMTTSIVNSDSADKSEIQFVIFDMFPKECIANNRVPEKYEMRKARMQDMRQIFKQKGVTSLAVVEMLYEGNDTNEIWKWLDVGETKGWEGIMLNKNTPYEFKRTTNLIKIKKFHDIALRCTSVNIADTGKYQGIMGSITCKYYDGFVDCGSGFSDEDRVFYAEHPEEIVGKIISIKYKDESKNKDGGKSLQFPVYLGIVAEIDKTIPDDEI
jgi:DNA ligase-1